MRSAKGSSGVVRRFWLRGLVCSAIAACGSGQVPGDQRQPRCEARKTTDPARLNIDSAAERFGLGAPCEASLRFYIAADTPLRRLKARLRVTDASGKAVDSMAVSGALTDNGAGMLTHEAGLPAVAGYGCRSLQVEMQSLRCLGVGGARIDCPSVRLKTSMVFEGLTIRNDGLDLCHDD